MLHKTSLFHPCNEKILVSNSKATFLFSGFSVIFHIENFIPILTVATPITTSLYLTGKQSFLFKVFNNSSFKSHCFWKSRNREFVEVLLENFKWESLSHTFLIYVNRVSLDCLAGIFSLQELCFCEHNLPSNKSQFSIQTQPYKAST